MWEIKIDANSDKKSLELLDYQNKSIIDIVEVLNNTVKLI